MAANYYYVFHAMSPGKMGRFYTLTDSFRNREAKCHCTVETKTR